MPRRVSASALLSAHMSSLYQVGAAALEGPLDLGAGCSHTAVEAETMHALAHKLTSSSTLFSSLVKALSFTALLHTARTDLIVAILLRRRSWLSIVVVLWLPISLLWRSASRQHASGTTPRLLTYGGP